jgi:hypothetical protein
MVLCYLRDNQRRAVAMDATALGIIIAASFAAGYGVRAYRAARRRRIFWT